jgi:uncharacterized protein with PIN domain
MKSESMKAINPKCPSCKLDVQQISFRAPKNGVGVAMAFCPSCGVVLGVFWVGQVPKEMLEAWALQ